MTPDIGTPAIGHNSVSEDRLRSLIERVERLAEERKSLSSDIREIFIEAKSAGYDVKVLRAIIAERAKDAADVAEFEAIRDTYRHALGME